MVQIEQLVCGCRGLPDTPVDADGLGAHGKLLDLNLDDEASVPVSETVLEYPHARWLTRKLSRPDNSAAQTTGKDEPAFSNGETTFRVVE